MSDDVDEDAGTEGDTDTGTEGETGTEGDTGTDAETDAEPAAAAAKTRHGPHTSAAVIGVLTLLLGFAIAVQVHANSSSDSLSSLREDDLIGILDNQNSRADRLRAQITQLQDSLRTLQDSGNRAGAAQAQARAEARTLGVLLGTLPATGPGVTIAVSDPDAKLSGEDVLDIVEELRGAGAEAIQFGPVRISTSSSFEGSGGSISVDGHTVRPPYLVTAIGEAKTLDTAVNIPGGVAATVRAAGGELTVTEHGKVTITVVRAVPVPKYATPSK